MIKTWKNLQILTFAIFTQFHIYIYTKRNIGCLYVTHVERFTDCYRSNFKLSAYKYLQNITFLSNWKLTLLIVVSKAEFVNCCIEIMLLAVFNYVLLCISLYVHKSV